MNKTRIPSMSKTVVILTLALLAVTAVALAFNDYIAYVITLTAIFAVVAVSFDVLLGFTGYLSMAHGALFGLGAYVSGILTTRYGLDFWAALPVAGLLTGLAGALIAGIAFRTKGLYFAVLTLGIGLIGHQLFIVLSPWTGGGGGLVAIPSPSQPSWLPLSDTGYGAVLALALLWVTYLACTVFVRSRLGADCLAVREDQTLAQAMGISVAVARLSAFAFSAIFAGLAGALFGATSNFIAPDSFTVMGMGFQLVALVVVGGMGTLWGAVLGAALLTLLPELLRFTAGYSLLIYGVLLFVFVIFVPGGLAGLLRKAAGKLRTKSPSVSVNTATAQVQP